MEMSDKHLINHLQSQSLHQGKAVPSHISTQPNPSDITGHEVLIFHSSQYPLAVNRIYTRPSTSQGGLPCPYATTGIFSPSERAHSKLALHQLQLFVSTRERRLWKLTVRPRMELVSAVIWTETKSSRGESEAFFLPPQISK